MLFLHINGSIKFFKKNNSKAFTPYLANKPFTIENKRPDSCIYPNENLTMHIKNMQRMIMYSNNCFAFLFSLYYNVK